MTIYRVEHKRNYTVINNFICKDKRLSWKAKGIWLYAFSRPDDWQFNLTDLLNQSTDGKDSVYAGLKELETLGYLQRQKKRSDGKFSGAEWVFYETPQELKEFPPQTENPDTVNPVTEKPPLLSTDKLLSTEKKQQQAEPVSAAVSYKKEERKPKIYPCLQNLDIPEADKIDITRSYSDQIVINAIEWASDIDNPPTKCLTASIKFAAKKGLSKKNLAKHKVEPYEEIQQHFKNGEIYNSADCYLNKECIAFQRGLKQDKVSFEFFCWKKFKSMCESFGIIFNRSRKINE